MGVHTELQFQKYCRVGRSPRDVPLCYSSKAEGRYVKRNPTRRGYDLKSIGQEYTEISFDDSQNSFYRSVQYGPAGIAGNEELKRGSIYQSSKEVRTMKKMGEFEGRRKIELLHSSDSSLPFQIVDSLSQSNDSSSYAQQKRLSLTSSTTDLSTTLDNRTHMELNSKDSLDLSFRLFSSPGNVKCKDTPSDNFFEICLDAEDRKHDSAETIARDTAEKLNLRCDQSVAPLNSGHCLLGRDTVLALQKTSSAKAGMPHSRIWSKSDRSKAGAKVRFNPIRRILDPIMKSRSQRSQPVSVAEFGDVTTVGLPSIRRNKTACKSLLNDYAISVQKEESSAHFVKKDQHSLDVALSPAHLQGLLKLEYKHGVPFLEFSLNNLEDTLVAKTWKGHNAFNWVYTFHSLNNRRKSGSGWNSKEKHKEASMIGQMQVSCYLCSEMRNSGGFDNSMVTEFVLYDIAHTRKSFGTQDSPDCQTDPTKHPKAPSIGDLDKSSSMDLNGVFSPAKLKHQVRHASDDSDASTAYPWAPADLHPYLEIAAISIQVPFQKRESLKDKEGVCGKASSNSFDLSVVEQRSDDAPHYLSPAKVKAVTSTGTHGLPCTRDGGGPSPLLDRWRSGGGCDCGGWDMACPIVVFGNASSPNVGDHHFGNRMPLELFVQGAKEKMPALTMNLIDEGQYLVDFHAQLSTLQAFSICVAILHSAADCTGAGQERTKQRLQCNSLKLLLEEEVRFLIEAVAEEEKRKTAKRVEEIPPSFVVNPPFSPISRV
ncbi:uncharacterized protein LOC122082335 [Macadamia integrifolia]|uniref:uncharacterized protein LOC122082335 n=1 Tax=Macadamia integrifolia TaxID=60698 RepID=UPI001C4FE94C|nr:uncharacterized protein LOC122082335 [Macadamia integrifolia]XP_042505764.1 uncharacterized protein LOC122082335 [Macadamia integrifolia]